MAIALIHYYEGGTQEQYDKTLAAVHPEGGGLPSGQTHHFAGPTDDGYKVIAIWDSQESLDTFISDVLQPAFAELEGGFEGPPAEQTFEVANSVTA